MDHPKIADLQARMTALAAELAVLADDAPPATDPSIEITNLAEDSDRLKAPKPKQHGRDEGLAEARKRFPAPATEESTDEPSRETGRAAGAAEAARRFGKGH